MVWRARRWLVLLCPEAVLLPGNTFRGTFSITKERVKFLLLTTELRFLLSLLGAEVSDGALLTANGGRGLTWASPIQISLRDSLLSDGRAEASSAHHELNFLMSSLFVLKWWAAKLVTEPAKHSGHDLSSTSREACHGDKFD